MRREPPAKILAIQLKNLGDAMMLIPALNAIRDHWPACALHVLVTEEAVPLLQHLPGLARVWPMRRVHGEARIRQTWPLISALRAERFDRLVDFSSSDRSAILSRLCGAPERLGAIYSGGFPGRRFCYTRRVAPAPLDQHESRRLINVLSAWGVAPPRETKIEIRTDPAQDAFAAQILPADTILCHMGGGKPKKQWPVRHWATLHRIATDAGLRLAFTTGWNARERALVAELKTLAPGATVLPEMADLRIFLAVVKRARALICGDTGPIHFAAGLSVPVIALFGPTSPVRWRPLGQNCRILTGSPCTCAGATYDCESTRHCLAAISPEQVWAGLQTLLKPG